MKDRVNLRVDFAFKQLFGTKGNEEILIGFLNAVLQKSLTSPIMKVVLNDPHVYKEYQEDKLSIMEVRATLGTGELVNIEIQIANKHDMQKRSLYYWSKLYASQMQEGMSYSELQKAITINVLDFILYPDQEHFQTTGVLWDVEKDLRISEDIEIHYIELPKIIAQWRDAQVNPRQDALARWLLLLAAHEDVNLTEALEEIAVEQDETLNKAIHKWDVMSHNIGFRREYEAREKRLLDEKAVVAHAERKGQAKIIKKMYDSGMTPQDIADIVKVPVSEIQHILHLS
ncbi:Rpn family recombination-promoting nuclease/putative transposase [Bacillus thuringiensis]|uniref:Rpn family recombination-promoting nuclease/putative transposase n=1 Tax=Bacillus thuringiensis TaxID=1428 RepID=UPI000E50A7F2|nr:Rpn family recombination-promoting nuclease/putative transposase [Bacillus thuringiensis]MDZ3952385.1 Rpn family recombination-promoting nuclease/putative transposase [Bacillus thuringiensis]RGP45211.1 ATPase [Bacillus thuringiensis]